MNLEAAKTPALSSGITGKYKYMIGEAYYLQINVEDRAS